MSLVYDRSSIENKENVTLIWFDSNKHDNNEAASLLETLHTLNDYVLIYNNIYECISYITTVTNERIFLVTFGVWASSLLPSIIDLKQLEVVFILCVQHEEYLYLMKIFPKISGIFIDRQELNASIRKSLYLINKQVETFSFYDQKQKVSINVSERAAHFFW